MKLPKNLANILLAVYLILAGAAIFHFSFPFMEYIMGICAIAAGILILLKK